MHVPSSRISIEELLNESLVMKVAVFEFRCEANWWGSPVRARIFNIKMHKGIRTMVQ